MLANAGLLPNYALPPRVKITVEGLEHLPDTPVIFAMNHTDRYNYWPFQYRLYRERQRFTATWVKGKYYEGKFVGWFMEKMANLPTVSRGYLITKDVLTTLGRRPSDAEYRYLRRLVEAADHDASDTSGSDVPSDVDLSALKPIFETKRTILGEPYDPAQRSWPDAVNRLFAGMMDLFVKLNEQAIEVGLDVLIFPQGTRSIQLTPGRIGMAQIAYHLGVPIVPVGCNGSDRCYPSGSPIAKAGTIHYRVGAPIEAAVVDAHRPSTTFTPFKPADEALHRASFQGLTDHVMNRINDLVDEPYKFGIDTEGAVVGSDRFL